jgi:hypothetical protein
MLMSGNRQILVRKICHLPIMFSTSLFATMVHVFHFALYAAFAATPKDDDLT